MLRRKMTTFLERWRANKHQECLLIKGARQVGKSYAVERFGERAYQHFIKIDFILEPGLREVFEGSIDADSIFRRISLVKEDARFVPGETLLFLDEIQECPLARTALKYLALDDRIDVIASSSLLGIEFKEEQTSIPVGYERQIEMHPLDFEEFLWARGYDAQTLDGLREYAVDLAQVPNVVHEHMMGLLREYLAVGGMPDVVQQFVDSQSFAVAHEVQRAILASYEDDMARYATASERVKARACYRSLPRQLAKENTKFQYSVVEKRASARKFEGSVDWLEGARMVLRCRALSTAAFPLKSYEQNDRFRLYANDTGLLMGMHDFTMMAPVVNNTLKGPMKGGLYENLVACMLSARDYPLRFWRNDRGDREIEFLLDGADTTVVPIEVKAGRGSTVSLNEFLDRDDVHVGYKFLDGNVGRVGKKVSLPLYLLPFVNLCTLPPAMTAEERRAD